MSVTTKKICVNAMGIALFTTLTLCLQVPVFENYYLCLGYVVMSVFCCSFGAVSGMITGSMGVVLYCVLTSGLRGMPGWALGNLVIALGMAVAFQGAGKFPRLRFLILFAAIFLSTAAGILLVKSAVESFLYAQPLFFRAAKNSYAFLADVVVLLASLPVALSLRPFLKKSFPSQSK